MKFQVHIIYVHNKVLKMLHFDIFEILLTKISKFTWVVLDVCLATKNHFHVNCKWNFEPKKPQNDLKQTTT